MILFGNTVVNITASAIAASIAAGMFPDNSSLSLALAVGSMTFLLLVFGEISPKTLAVARAEQWASRSSSTLLVFMKLCTPIASTLSKFSKFISGKIGINSPGSRLSREEIIALVELGQSEGLLGSEGGATLNLLTLNESQCTDVMKPRSEVAVLRMGWDEERFSEVMRSKGFTRFPVLDGPMENVIGYVDSREYFVTGDGEPLTLHDLPSFPENAHLETVLKGLRSSDEDAGAVFDEYGDWTGIVTVHDILDYFLFSSAAPPGTLPPGVSVRDEWLLVPAALKLSTLSELSGKKFEARYAETCGGLIQEVTGRIPEEREKIEISGYIFRITSKEGPRIDRLEIRLITDEEPMR